MAMNVTGNRFHGDYARKTLSRPRARSLWSTSVLSSETRVSQSPTLVRSFTVPPNEYTAKRVAVVYRCDREEHTEDAEEDLEGDFNGVVYFRHIDECMWNGFGSGD